MAQSKQDEPVGPIRNAAAKLSPGFQDTRTPPAPNDNTPIVDMEAANNQAAAALQQEAYQQRMQAPYVPMGQLRSGVLNTGAVIPSLAEQAAKPGVGYQAPAPVEQPKASPAPTLPRASDFNAEDDPQFREQQRRERDAATRIAGAKKGIPTTTAAGTLPSVDFNGRPLPPSDPQSRESRARQQAQAVMDQVMAASAAKTAANPPRAGAQAQAEMDKMMAADAAKTPGDPSRLSLRGVPTDPSRRGQLGAPNVGVGGSTPVDSDRYTLGQAYKAQQDALRNGRAAPSAFPTSPTGTPTGSPSPTTTSAGVTYAPDITGGVSPVDYGGQPQAGVVGTSAGPRLQGNNGVTIPFVNDPFTGTSLPLSTGFSAEEYAQAITPEQREQLIDSIATANNDTGRSMRAFLNGQGKGQTADSLSPAEKEQNNAGLDRRIDNLIYGVMRNPSMFMRDRNKQRQDQDRGSRQDQAKVAMEERKKVAEAAKAATAQQRAMQRIYQESEKQARAELTANKFQAPSEQQIQARALQLARAKGFAPMGSPQQGQGQPQSGAPDLSEQPRQPQQPQQPQRYSMSGNSPMQFKVDRDGYVDAFDPETNQTFPATRVGSRLVVVATGPEVVDAISVGTEYVLQGKPTEILIKKADGQATATPESKFASPEEDAYKIEQAAKTVAEKRKPVFEQYQKDRQMYDSMKEEADLRAAESAGATSGNKFLQEQEKALLELANEKYGAEDEPSKIPSWIKRQGKRLTAVTIPPVPEELKTSKDEFDAGETKKSAEARSAAVKEAKGIERSIVSLVDGVIKKDGGVPKTANDVNSRADNAVRSLNLLNKQLEKANDVGGTMYGNALAKSGQGKTARMLLQYAIDPTAVDGGFIYPPSEDTNPIQFEKDISAVIESAGPSGAAIMKRAFAPFYDASKPNRLVYGNNNPIDASNKDFVAARNFVFANSDNQQLVRDWSRLTNLYSETPNYDPANPEGNQKVGFLLKDLQRTSTESVVGKFSPGAFDPTKPGAADMSAAETEYYRAGQTNKEKVSQSRLAAKAASAYSKQVFYNAQTGKQEVMVKGSPVPAVSMRIAGQAVRVPAPENARQVMQMIDAGLPFNSGGKLVTVDQTTPQYKAIVEQKDKVVLNGMAGENPGVKAANEFVRANFGYLSPTEQKSLYEMILKKNGYQQQ